MATLRCPRCSTLVSAAPGGTASCPSCGFTAKVPDLPPAAPKAAPAPAPPPPPELPPLAPPPADWPAADWTAAKPTASPPVGPPAAAPPLTPAPAAATPAWAERGKTVEPWVVVVLSIVTLGVYDLFYWWRVSREADLLKGRRHAHGLARTGILMLALGLLVAALFVVVVLIQAVATLGPEPTDDEVLDAIGDAALPLLAAIILPMLVAAAGGIVLLVAMYRSWGSIRDAELAAGRPDTVRPALYLFLPIGLSLAGSLVDPASQTLGSLLSLASAIVATVFMAITQSRLNRLWSLGAAGPAPAPAAR